MWRGSESFWGDGEMKILQIANGYFGSKLYRNLFSALEGFSVESAVYVPINRKAPDPPKERNVVISKCFSDLDRLLFFSKQRNMLRDVEACFDLKGLDVVHAHTVFSGGYTALQLRRRHGLPYLTAVRNTDINVFFKRMPHLRLTGVRVLQEAERIIFLSPAYQEQLFSQYVPVFLRRELEEKSLVIPNGIAPLFFENPPPPREGPSAVPRLIYVGEVSSNKNLELTVQAAELLCQRGREVRLTVVGAVKEEKYCTVLQRVDEYHDRCSQEEVLQYLHASDIFVMPSHTETFGLVYAEAMSQGLPVLYTRGQGFDGQFPDGTVGYAVSDKDPEELVKKIEMVLFDYSRLSSNCVANASRFEWKRIAEEYRNLYEAAIL